MINATTAKNICLDCFLPVDIAGQEEYYVCNGIPATLGCYGEKQGCGRLYHRDCHGVNATFNTWRCKNPACPCSEHPNPVDDIFSQAMTAVIDQEGFLGNICKILTAKLLVWSPDVWCFSRKKYSAFDQLFSKAANPQSPLEISRFVRSLSKNEVFQRSLVTETCAMMRRVALTASSEEKRDYFTSPDSITDDLQRLQMNIKKLIDNPEDPIALGFIADWNKLLVTSTQAEVVPSLPKATDEAFNLIQENFNTLFSANDSGVQNFSQSKLALALKNTGIHPHKPVGAIMAQQMSYCSRFLRLIVVPGVMAAVPITLLTTKIARGLVYPPNQCVPIPGVPCGPGDPPRELPITGFNYLEDHLGTTWTIVVIVIYALIWLYVLFKLNWPKVLGDMKGKIYSVICCKSCRSKKDEEDERTPILAGRGAHGAASINNVAGAGSAAAASETGAAAHGAGAAAASETGAAAHGAGAAAHGAGAAAHGAGAAATHGAGAAATHGAGTPYA